MTQIRLLVRLTWSKIMAFVILASAIFEDIYFDLDGKLLMFAIPFVATLIGVKQYFDRNKTENDGNTN